jgi:hypothetical protein
MGSAVVDAPHRSGRETTRRRALIAQQHRARLHRGVGVVPERSYPSRRVASRIASTSAWESGRFGGGGFADDRTVACGDRRDRAVAAGERLVAAREDGVMKRSSSVMTRLT